MMGIWVYFTGHSCGK